MSGREMAWRVLADELSRSVEEERGAGERAASYVVSPLGARMNRVLLAGTLAPSEPIGQDPNAPFFRSRLSDPTGTISVTAGSFQPRALESLRALNAPQEALIVGKAHLFRGRDGNAYPSVRAEALRTVSDRELKALLAEALGQTLRRIAIARALRNEPPEEEVSLRSKGYPAPWIRAGKEAIARYPSADPEAFRAPLDALFRWLRDGALGSKPLPAPPTAPSPRSVSPGGESSGESAFLSILDELVADSADGFADLSELVERAAHRRIDAERAEELLGRLEEAGEIEEPVVGKLRRA